MSKPLPWLQDPKETVRILQKYQFRFQKKFGQNFLIDAHVLNKIIAAAGIGEDDFVLEIGPGIGTLTQHLAYAAREVAAVEIDSRLLPVLEETLDGYDNVTVIHEDILKLDIHQLVQEKNGGRPIKVVANLPYYITTPIIMGLFEKAIPTESLTVMVQKEVAERMDAAPGTKNYGALTLAVQYYSEVYLAANVPPNCFMPRPDVASAVVRLTTRKERQKVSDEALMFRLIKAAFGQRRKTLLNCLRNCGDFNLTKEDWEAVFAACGIDPSVRGETLDLAQFAQLTEETAKRIE